jgi:hypothetical protein
LVNVRILDVNAAPVAGSVDGTQLVDVKEALLAVRVELERVRVAGEVLDAEPVTRRRARRRRYFAPRAVTVSAGLPTGHWREKRSLGSSPRFAAPYQGHRATPSSYTDHLPASRRSHGRVPSADAQLGAEASIVARLARWTSSGVGGSTSSQIIAKPLSSS